MSEMNEVSEERPTALSWSLRRHYLGDGKTVYLYPGGPGKTVLTALCDNDQTIYTVDQLRVFGFADSSLDKDHPMCKRCVRKAT
jgi:hypothetical protein